MTLASRFEGSDGQRRLVEALQSQRVVTGSVKLAEQLAQAIELIPLDTNATLIDQGSFDQDVYFIVAGALDIVVNGKVIARRHVNETVGEMSAILTSQPRSATVIATEPSLVGRLTEPALTTIAHDHPEIWRALAKELARRLYERNHLLAAPRPAVRVFIMSSTEGLGIARAIQSAFENDPFLPIIWENGVFRASGYPIESLEAELDRCDFAIAVVEPDDLVTSRGATRPAPRDNVIFELGYFMGRLGRMRTIMVEPRDAHVKLPSDLAGITTVGYRYGDPADLLASLGPACNRIRSIIKELGPI